MVSEIKIADIIGSKAMPPPEWISAFAQDNILPYRLTKILG